MFRRSREQLARLRVDPSAWETVAYAEERDERDDQLDRNESAREAVLQALQYDRRPEDAGLLRFLLEQEVLWHEDSELQGLTESLALACYLVGLMRSPEDIWRLARAKAANFDTECGLARELLFGAGVAETIAYVEASGRANAASTLAVLVDEGQPLCSQEDVDAYWQAMRGYYPASPALEHPLTVASRAVDQDELEEGVAALERWLADAERIAEEGERTLAIDARWAADLVRSLLDLEPAEALRGRLAAIEAGLP